MRNDIATVIAESLFDTDERLHFLELCEPRPVDDLAADRSRIAAYVRRVSRAAEADPTIDSDAAARVGLALEGLITDRHRLVFEERRLLAGAIEYFLLPGDDNRDLYGLDDDARVVRTVCRALERPDLADTV
ncbi:hypothetical protein HQ535_01285 [bacterium]|nr:hypothetical protein [bacterium]